MKRCPECRRDYYDETLLYCLDDGSALLEGPATTDEPATAILSEPGDVATGVVDTEGPTRTIGPSDTAQRGPSPSKTSEKTAVELAAGRKKLIAGSLGILLVVLLGFGGYWLYGERAAKPIDSIAVLPFVNKSGNPDSEYLSDGLAESLIYRLSQLPDLKVSPPSTVMQYKGRDIDPIKVGKELGVSAVVSGRIVQRDGNLTISADLIDIRQNKILWGEQYDRKMSDLLATQREIAREIVSNLKLKVSGNERSLAKHYTDNNEAYQLYLKARFHWNKRAVEGNRKAIEYLNQAIEKDPGFALAYAGLADAYSVPSSQMAPDDAMPMAKAAATRALELDDTLAEAHTSMGRVLAAYDWNWARADQEFKRAIELNPRYALAHSWYGSYLAAVGRLDASVAEKKLALELDPLSPIAVFDLGQSLFWSRDYKGAIEQFQKAIELDPDLPPAYLYTLLALGQMGRYEDAIELFQKMPLKQGNEWGSSVAAVAHIYAITGRKQEARTLLAQIQDAEKSQYIPAPSIAYVYSGLGERDQAFAWMEKGFKQRAFHLQWLKVDPRWDELRSDPRFADLERRVGLPQ
ncbi:MAG: tetratricopeptide repeat protein [Pyrinomonadaceae bacterium]